MRRGKDSAWSGEQPRQGTGTFGQVGNLVLPSSRQPRGPGAKISNLNNYTVKSLPATFLADLTPNENE